MNLDNVKAQNACKTECLIDIQWELDVVSNVNQETEADGSLSMRPA